jgi:hypothetical protein
MRLRPNKANLYGADVAYKAKEITIEVDVASKANVADEAANPMSIGRKKTSEFGLSRTISGQKIPNCWRKV